MTRRPSIREVSQLAGVSLGTASNVLNHPERVSDHTRKKVEAAIEKLGFIPSEAGRRLRRVDSKLVGVLVFDVANPFFAAAASAIEARLAEESCFPVIGSTGGDPEREAGLLRLLLGQEVRGIILTPSAGAEKSLELLETRRIPLVLLDHPALKAGMNAVSVDDTRGAEIAIEHLRELGHHHIGFINGSAKVRQAQARRIGVRQTVMKSDDFLTLVEISAERFDAASGERAMTKLLATHPEVTAVFCANDSLAIGAMRAARRHHLAIPRDMSIIGFDDIDVARELITPLTTIRQPMEQLGETAAHLLLEQPSEAQDIAFIPELVVRESTAPPRPQTH
ncbi:LacI family DNA-binding transcriptional regulator [Actinotignum sanguinis]|uniref:LacI family DNA-binding transcriptional regulator n=2 Tax=Actinomycetaceae TaxID=2049 RepID=A0ABZ0RC35_9ACTO|nr:LacI family DNA-binding transcriptional regulator [Actinotignum sanguinis]WPJ88783.1 LacI family DNA-binding transcriptional regulator [Schaalia turicensis]MDE1552933.1 LacI family DNA-binding transcriptional regulator [Actinotignum sanguinis]MDE1564851.1 LacI family DNA-binding transcriptional regulator [Actinotignum sanguinis]MDE1576594.1 LacI family DNA-binding transcriptional regulator [Actinotignum sanguinis]MDE1641509.1 LacI family DNA-binding transcriptional regulator [Actinotignum s